MNHFFGCQIFSSRIGRLYCANNSPRCSVLAFCELRGPKTHDHEPVAALVTSRQGARSNRIFEKYWDRGIGIW